jgi:hypothetical protein
MVEVSTLPMMVYQQEGTRLAMLITVVKSLTLQT